MVHRTVTYVLMCSHCVIHNKITFTKNKKKSRGSDYYFFLKKSISFKKKRQIKIITYMMACTVFCV